MWTPFTGQRARKVDDGTFAGVVGKGWLAVMSVAPEASDRGQVDHPPKSVGEHRQPPDLLRQQEDGAHVQVHDLVPSAQRVVDGGRAPCGAGVVDEDVYL